MSFTMSDIAVEATAPAEEVVSTEVVLADGARLDISGLDEDELRGLQWEQERQFARRILAAPKGSRRRAEATREAYDTVTTIVDAAEGTSDQTLLMGMDPRYEQIVRGVLRQQCIEGIQPSFFEIGFGAGSLLKKVSDWGYSVAGIEVSPVLGRQARRLMGPYSEGNLLLGSFLEHEFDASQDRYSLVYWNDVFEHVPPDEIDDYLEKIHVLLAPGGSLVTITPNWHMRPSDITAVMCPPRTEAAGLHLKEYTLREVTRLLRRQGFDRVATPLFLTYHRVFTCRGGLAWLKRLLEPALEWLPYRPAQILCRGLGLGCTVATKGTTD